MGLKFMLSAKTSSSVTKKKKKEYLAHNPFRFYQQTYEYL